MGLQGKVWVMTNPWNGVLTATATPFKADLSIDYDKYAEHVAWLAANGTHGVIPNGSLGEYQVLTAEERAKMVEVAVAAAPKGFSVVPGVAAYGAAESRKWAEHAQKAGAGAVMLLPPNAYRASDDEVVAHYKEVARVGIPIIAYNNPFDTKVDLTPNSLHESQMRFLELSQSRSSQAMFAESGRSNDLHHALK